MRDDVAGLITDRWPSGGEDSGVAWNKGVDFLPRGMSIVLYIEQLTGKIHALAA